jgi:hypothetical protein
MMQIQTFKDLDEYRKKKGVEKGELCAAIGVHSTNYARWMETEGITLKHFNAMIEYLKQTKGKVNTTSHKS